MEHQEAVKALISRAQSTWPAPARPRQPACERFESLLHALNVSTSPLNARCVLQKNGIGLKGPMATPVGKGHRSLNLTLRKELQLYANVRPCLSIPGYKTRYDNVDLVTVREVSTSATPALLGVLL